MVRFGHSVAANVTMARAEQVGLAALVFAFPQIFRQTLCGQLLSFPKRA
jgi:hypothetical protein